MPRPSATHLRSPLDARELCGAAAPPAPGAFVAFTTAPVFGPLLSRTGEVQVAQTCVDDSGPSRSLAEIGNQVDGHR